EVAHHNNDFLRMFAETPQFIPPIRDMRWTLLDAAPDARQFATSDEPVAMWARPGHPEWQGIGLLTAKKITVPVSPKRCLRLEFVFDDETKPEPELLPNPGDLRRQASALEVEMINNITIAWAHTFVFAHL